MERMNDAQRFAAVLASYPADAEGYRGMEFERNIRQFRVSRYVDGRFAYNSIDSTEICVFTDKSVLRVSNPHEVEFTAYWQEISMDDAILGKFIVTY